MILNNDETMKEIDRLDASSTGNKRDDLQADIVNLERSLKEAQEAETHSKNKERSFMPVTPELANKYHRDVVFLKKDLDKKKAELDRLDE